MPKASFFKDKRILVTGGLGFIGKKLVQSLTLQGAKLIVLDIKSKDDIRDFRRLSRIKGRIDLIFHLAAVSYVPYAWQHPRQTLETNLAGAINILELCRVKKVKQLVYMSSYVYGQPQYLPIDEYHPVEPANPYAWSKYLGENLCRAYSSNYGMNCIILRPFNVYGAEQSRQFLIPSIMDQIKKGRKVILDSSYPKRDLLYIDDMVAALVAAGKYRPRGIEIFNIGYGKSYSVKDIAKKAIGIAGGKLRLIFRNNERKGEVPDVIADIKKANRRLNWRPRIGLDEGLRKCLEFQSNRS
jgi:UDP-glucose 4-epimerase